MKGLGLMGQMGASDMPCVTRCLSPASRRGSCPHSEPTAAFWGASLASLALLQGSAPVPCLSSAPKQRERNLKVLF